MNDRLLDALEICLKALNNGTSLEDCLKLYPDMASDLRPLLRTAQAASTMPPSQIPAVAMKRSRTKILAYAMQLRTPIKQSKQLSFWVWLTTPVRAIKRMSVSAGRLVIASLVALLLVLTSGGLLVTSAKSLPGDTLYPVKRAVENIGVQLAPNGEIQHTFEHNYIQQRISEVQSLIILKRIQQVSFEGVVESRIGNQLLVSGILVNIKADTTIIGGFNESQSIELGTQVEVEGVTQKEGWVTAKEIHLREYHFIGTVESIGASLWQISGTQFQITPMTQIDSGIMVSDNVTVLVRSEDNGLFALAIIRLGQPVPTPTLNREEMVITGTVETMAGNYWVISGQIVYIVTYTELPESIKIGENVKAQVIVESNGSLTATEIEKIEPGDNVEEMYSQDTPEYNGREEENYTTPTPSPDNGGGDETPEVTHTHGESETPESTDDHEEPEGLTVTPTLP